jgi:hypothetical protein
MSERQKLFLVFDPGNYWATYAYGHEPEEAIEGHFVSLDGYCSPSEEVAAEAETEVSEVVCVEIPEIEEDAMREKVEDLPSDGLVDLVEDLLANRRDLPTTKVEITFTRITDRSYRRLP